MKTIENIKQEIKKQLKDLKIEEEVIFIERKSLSEWASFSEWESLILEEIKIINKQIELNKILIDLN
jgi:hypothetical protein